ncbi:hypothetical protein BpHYR1_003824 [Brachionus plicatilis]|uniref:Ig-like domain-containing protein n=1 Tax=Brachionus plicatilis TaxID=10195 RepID=A0A3M7RTA4_BRAPC|nr:hypothetical protein BpHYR1_003824 [Brachionus plicatilis]
MRLCSLLITLCALSSVYCQSSEPVTASSLVQKDGRRPSFTQYSLNLLVKMDQPLTLRTMGKWKMIFWILGQYKSKSMAVQETDATSPDKLTIFNVIDPAIRNSTIRTQFMCSPTEQACNTLTVPSFGINYLGTYSNQAQVESAINNVFVDFNISAYIDQLSFKCDSGDCDYDKSSRLLNVVSDKKLTLECSVVVVQNSLYTPAAQLAIWSDMNQFGECPGETNIQKIAQSDTHLYLNTSSGIDIHLYKLSKRCDRTFGKEDIGKSYKCELKPVNQSVPAEMQNLNVLESLSNRIDVHYGPEYTQSANQQFNKTLIAGQTVSAYFTCPFESNPAPVYEWRLKHVVYNQTDSASKRLSLSASEFSPMNKDFSIPKELEVGFYQFQCRAKTEGLINKMSDIITFNLNIIGISAGQLKKSLNFWYSSSGFKYFVFRFNIYDNFYAKTKTKHLLEGKMKIIIFIFSLKNHQFTLVRLEMYRLFIYSFKVCSQINRFCWTITLGNKLNPIEKNTKTNTGAIIGGVIGGVAALIIIVLLVLFIIRRTKNSGPKDEIEKAKDGNNKHDRNSSINVVDEHGESAHGLGESSSLAANKINPSTNLNESSTSDEAQDAKSELPILEIKHSMGDISPKRISELTSSATDFVFSNSNPNINATSYRVIPGSGFYSPSTAEARVKDAAAKDSNLSTTAKLVRKQQEQLGSSSLGNIDINDGNPHLSSRTSLTTNTSSKQSQSNGTSGQKTIPGMMVANSTAQSYAAIAHAAAAAAAVNQQRNQFGGNQIDFSSSGSSQNLTKSYNNPGFFETGSYSNQVKFRWNGPSAHPV